MHLFGPTNTDEMQSRGPLTILPDEPRKPRLRSDGMQFRERQLSSAGVRDLIALSGMEIQGIAPKPRKKSKQPNFMSKNIKDVEKLNNEVHKLKIALTPESTHAPRQRPASAERFKHVKSKIAEQIRQRPQSSAAILGKEDHMTEIMKIENANGKCSSAKPNHANSEPKTPRPASVEPKISPPKEKVLKADDFIKLNINNACKQNALRKRCKSASAVDKIMQNVHKPGVIPKYLIHRKIQWQPKPEPDQVPAGHRIMQEEEKINTIQMLKQAELELLSKLNSLPVRTDTEFLRRKKSECESRLIEIDEAVKTISKPKVFVKIDRNDSTDKSPNHVLTK